MNIQYTFGARVQARHFRVSNWRKIVHISAPAFSEKSWRNRLKLSGFSSYRTIPDPKVSPRRLLRHYNIFSSPNFWRIKGTPDSSVDIATNQLTGSQQNCVSVPCRGKRLPSAPRQQYRLFDGPSIQFNGYRKTSRGTV